VNELSFRARPHDNAHSTLGVDTGATGPRWRVDSIEGGGWGGGGDGEGGGRRVEGCEARGISKPVHIGPVVLLF
jgi:hypothetical protein